MTEVIGLLLAPGDATLIRPLVQSMASTVGFRAMQTKPLVDAGHVSPNEMTAWIVSESRLDEAALVAESNVAVIRGNSLVSLDGQSEIGLPATAPIEVKALPPVAPHVRRRWRERFELPEVFFVRTSELAQSDIATALTLASAAIVDAESVSMALALGTPTVVDAKLADRLGLIDGQEVLTGGDDRLAEIADSQAVAAGLSMRARVFAESRLDRSLLVASTLAALGLAPRVQVSSKLGSAPTAAFLDRLRDLSAPVSLPTG